MCPLAAAVELLLLLRRPAPFVAAPLLIAAAAVSCLAAPSALGCTSCATARAAPSCYATAAAADPGQVNSL